MKNILKEGLDYIRQEKLPIYLKKIEEEITHEFLFSNRYTIVNVSQGKKPFYQVIDSEQLHDINNYQSVSDFMLSPTGMPEWNSQYGFQNFLIRTKERWIEDIINELNQYMQQHVENPEDFLSPTSSQVKQIEAGLNNLNKLFWTDFLQQKFSSLIARNYQKVWQENQQMNLEIDSELAATEIRAHKFEAVLMDWLAFIESDKIVKLDLKQKETLRELHEWAKTKNYLELDLFEEFYPKSLKLQNFHWLPQALREKKKTDEKAVNTSIGNLLRTHGVKSSTQNAVEPQVQKVYKLRSEIIGLGGMRVIILNHDSEVYEFAIDEFNRIGYEESGADIFNGILNNMLQGKGAIVVYQVSDETYKIRKGTRYKTEKYHNVMGMIVAEGNYKGLTSDEMRAAHTVDHSTGEELSIQEGIKFLDWDIKG